ncbi:rho GTPase-activating protein 9 [Sinocyclocheilus rhinocerous]|uniref:rho GTPase-activating protein 9 n=1 Tax=Sinocyclocheilus rhinocerous TaxID=307959 RepID=UPI0007B88BF3|nr:PREDICTED: rho GTPase-activating protein 9 [Sinocyclocheilus rhinocerous]
MLSGSWRRGTVISSASGPGAFKGGSRSRLSSTVVLEAQYDYSYRAVDGRLVSIHEGERFLLLKKTNADWWQARRIGVGAKAKPIYVPATYVIELPISQSASESFKMIPRGSLTHCMQTHGSVPDKQFCRSMENLSCSSALMDKHRVSARGRFPTLPLSGSSASPSGHLSVPGVPIARSQSSSNLPQNPYQNQDPSPSSPTKSYSQWDVNAATRRHTQGHIQLSPDLTYITHDANGWQLSQSMQHAALSETLSSASCVLGDTHLRNSALAGGVAHVSHSYSMFLPSQRESANGKSDYRLVAEPPSDSSPDSEGVTPSDVFCVIFRKNWNPSWVVLVGNSLVFFKDPKSQNPDSWKPGNSCPESSVDLRGAQLQWANDLSSRKNVFKLRTVTGNEFLLQSETESLIREWYRTIQNVIDRLDKENPLDNVLLYSLRRAGSVEMLDQSGDEDENRAGNKMSLPRSASNLENSEHKRVKSRLKKLILRRPPLQTLQEKGLIKDQVFGCGLELLCEREKSTVPKFVRKCTDAVERRGLETDGIYRVSGNLAVIQKLRFAVNHERLDLDDPQWEDIHVITGALKLFFRELPEPLVPYGFFHDIVETVKLSDYLDKVDRLKLLVLSMPPHNPHTLRHMIRHLRRLHVFESESVVIETLEGAVSLHHKHTDEIIQAARIHETSLNTEDLKNMKIFLWFGISGGSNPQEALRFAVFSRTPQSGNMAINMVYQNQAVELLLSEYQRIFGAEQTGSY